MDKRVVITGLGSISPVGIGKDDFWNALTAGRSGIQRITAFDVSEYTSQIAGEITDFEPKDFMDAKQAKRMDRFTQFAVAAARLALEDSRFQVSQSNAERVGVIIGSGIGGLSTLEAQHKILIEKGPQKVTPFLVPMMICNIASGRASFYNIWSERS